MPTIQVDVIATMTDDGLIIDARQNDNVLQSTLLPAEITTTNDLASWLIAQRGRIKSTDTNLQKRLTITYHVDTVNDPETGQPADVAIIDSVTAAPLPQDDGREGFQNLPGWATWTATEAEAWINANVTDLASAKTALKSMAKAIIHLRNIAID